MSEEETEETRIPFIFAFGKEDYEDGKMPGILFTQNTPCGHEDCLSTAGHFALAAGPSVIHQGHFTVLMISEQGTFTELARFDEFEKAVNTGLYVFAQTFFEMGYTVDHVSITQKGWEVLER